MVFKLKNILPGALAVAGAFIATTANAQAPLAPAGLVFPPAVGFLGGAQVGALTSPFSFTNGSSVTIAGTIYSAVFNNAGTYDFYYQVTMDTLPIASTNLSNVSLASFTGFTTAVGNVNGDVDGAGPLTAVAAGPADSGLATRDGSGQGIVATWLAGVPAGATTSTFVVSTNANSFTTGTAGIQGTGGIATNADILAPLAVTGGSAPEPGTLVLAGLGIAGLVARRRRK